MKKAVFFTIIFFIVSLFTFSQNLSREVIASQGDYNKIDNMSLEWTLGDAFIETVVANNGFLTQGFQQPSHIKTAILSSESLLERPFNILLYPNPVNALLHIYIKPIDRVTLNISLYDISGQLLKKAKTIETDKNLTLDVSDLSSGIYLIKFSNVEGSLIETHRIIKY
ncbi:T9SS type A sorting domain-containing protein [Gaetbulibacter aquiaggeris]|uniref:T9SS type A sorting domain-containing protein n=1 Tax=Gaetbulibacter aquiaggeris TaxID=1735373 RepID=A0ABW7MS01_9FLAO